MSTARTGTSEIGRAGLSDARSAAAREPAIRRVELFTHPVCRGCREASLALGALAADGLIELVSWSLAIPSGRARASEAGVSTVPTALVGDVVRGLDTRQALESLVVELRARGRAFVR